MAISIKLEIESCYCSEFINPLEFLTFVSRGKGTWFYRGLEWLRSK